MKKFLDENRVPGVKVVKNFLKKHPPMPDGWSYTDVIARFKCKDFRIQTNQKLK